MQQIIGAASKDLVYDLIVAANPDTIERDDFEVSGVEANSDASITRNSHAVVTASSDSILYEGSTDVYYDRLDLSDVFYGLPRKLTTDSVPTDITAAVGLVIARWGLGLTVDEVSSSSLDTTAYPYSFSLIPNGDNYAYIGQVDFSIRIPPRDLDVQISTKQLNGLNFPYYQSTTGQGLLYSYGLNLSDYSDILSALRPGSVVPKSVADALTDITRDDWVVDTTPQPYNLRSATVLAAGASRILYNQDYPVPLEYTHAVVIQLSLLSTALQGVLVLPYNVPTN